MKYRYVLYFMVGSLTLLSMLTMGGIVGVILYAAITQSAGVQL